ncbi:hypothetical protein [Aquicella lusitana]|uniref:Uncharacterized protein n=1 Tax=Aquicella lusitana TaxID=254246 RepID=A0A370GXW1_9COXI|nr:hypothetical protein [Aquicella lusitana]RDI48116.1 hypothetical protein C8D86_10381 [Aquicella lusitana]VVC72868.1 hypothetical protein AQULUS_05920 [Aquicella lusitana]
MAFDRSAEEKKEKVIVHSWDFDGMLASETYYQEMEKLLKKKAESNGQLTEQDFEALAEIIIRHEAYQGFFDDRFKDKGDAEHILYVGSNRQGRKKDLENGFKKNVTSLTSFPFYAALAKKLSEHYGYEIKLDKLLLEDIAEGNKPGATFDEVSKTYLGHTLLDPDKSRETLTQSLKITDSSPSDYTDEEKGLLIYTQMHHAKKKYGKNREVEFDFADDRADILEKLAQMYGKGNEHLVPVRLMLSQFIPPDREKLSGEKEFSSQPIDPQNKEHNVDPAPFLTYLGLLANCREKVRTGAHMMLDLYDEDNYVKGDITFGNLGKTVEEHRFKHNQQYNQQNFIREVINLLNQVEKKSKGIVEMKELLAGVKEEYKYKTPADKIKGLQAIATKRLSKLHMGSQSEKDKGKFKLFNFKKSRDEFNEKLYDILKNMDVNNPDVTLILKLQDELQKRLEGSPRPDKRQ